MASCPPPPGGGGCSFLPTHAWLPVLLRCFLGPQSPLDTHPRSFLVKFVLFSYLSKISLADPRTGDIEPQGDLMIPHVILSNMCIEASEGTLSVLEKF